MGRYGPDILPTSAVDTVEIGDSQVTTAKIAADAVTNAKIADDQLDSEHYVAKSIDAEHMADSAVGAFAPADLVIYQTFSGAGTTNIFASNAPRKFQVVDFSVRLTAVGAGSETAKLTDGTNDITNALDLSGADNSVVSVGTIDDAYNEIAASGSLDLVIATGGDGIARIVCRPVA